MPLPLIFAFVLVRVGLCGDDFTIKYGHKFQPHSLLKPQNIRNNLKPDIPIELPAATSPSHAQLSASPNTISDMGSVNITAVFSDYTPHPDDYMIVSCGATNGIDDWLDKVPLNNKANQPPYYMQFVGLVFLRCDYKFTYIATNYYPVLKHVAIGSITVASAQPPTAPKLGHLQYDNDPTTMIFQYVTAKSKYKPAVRFIKAHHGNHKKLQQEEEWTTVTGKSATYYASSMCGREANITMQRAFRPPGYTHTIHIQKLQPSTQYQYQYGNQHDGWSDTYQFTTAPPVGHTNNNNKVRFIAFGDHSITKGAVSTAKGIYGFAQRKEIDFVLHIGDFGYAMGQGWVWDKWQWLITPTSTLVPWMVGIGNHEYDYDHDPYHKDPSGYPSKNGHSSYEPVWWNDGPNASNGECGVPTYYRFSAPKTGNTIFWYSFNWGLIHIVQWSSEHNFTVGSETWNWLDNDLASVDRGVTPWVIVTMHRPLYMTQECEAKCQVISDHLKKNLDGLLAKHKVNLVLVAHVHSYERICAIKDGLCQKNGKGTVHVTVGTGGAGLERCGFSPRYGNWSQSHINAWGYLHLEVTQQEINMQFHLDKDGSVFDHHTIKPWLA
eukprot:TRINITY_DN53590_c0_g1_i1.p1 TRINITY_DN53590_c0_g1~~TRINITY_DN53590_c0_g1_i1.p1  ORF type:complete len:606 (+),score=52.50 TRINITY_DN53590_c0_g1_i1:16-1833(+)